MAVSTNLSQADNSNHECRLLSLPRELRDIIYSLAVTQHKPITYCNHSWHSGTQPHIPPGIMRANRQTREEAMPIYWKQNVFRLDYSDQPPLIPAEIMEMKRIEIAFNSKPGCASGPLAFMLDLTKGFEKYNVCFADAKMKAKDQEKREKIAGVVEHEMSEHVKKGHKYMTMGECRHLLRCIRRAACGEDVDEYFW